MIEARHLRMLRAVAQAGSFSAAARELGCTQPAVSQQMKALELSAGTPLLVRTGRGIQLTEAGEVLARHAAGLLARLTAAEEAVAAIAGLRAGRVRLVSFPSGSSALVPAAVARMRAEHPGAEISLREAEPPESVAMLRAGECEVALAFRHPDTPDEGTGRQGAGGKAGGRGREGAGGTGAAGGGRSHDGTNRAEWAEWADLVVRPLLTERLVGLVPDGHDLAVTAGRGAALDVGDLAGERWIAGCPRCRGRLVEVCEAAGFTPRIDFATDDPAAVVGLVGAGLGVAMLPELALEGVRGTGVAFLAPRPAVYREVVALTLPDLAEVPAVRAMLTHLAAAAVR